MFARMKRGMYLVNTARGKICNRDAVVRALETGQLAGYAGDVWFPQPAPKEHPWRTMPDHGVTPHISGTSLSAQARYAAGTREILECWFEKRPIREEYLIVDGGKIAGTGARSYGAGDATRGSEEAAKFQDPVTAPLRRPHLRNATGAFGVRASSADIQPEGAASSAARYGAICTHESRRLGGSQKGVSRDEAKGRTVGPTRRITIVPTASSAGWASNGRPELLPMMLTGMTGFIKVVRLQSWQNRLIFAG
jgi:hypothetical protein